MSKDNKDQAMMSFVLLMSMILTGLIIPFLVVVAFTWINEKIEEKTRAKDTRRFR